MSGPGVDFEPSAWRTMLFAPADRPELLTKALAAGADAVIADLEDSVAPKGKDAARREACEFARVAPGAARVIRVNDPGTPAGVLDLEAIAAADPYAVMIPKASAESVAAAREVAPRVIALVESAAGLRAAAKIAAIEGVVAVALGTVDLAAEIGLRPLADGAELLFARASLVVDCAAAGLPAFDGVFLDPADDAGLTSEAVRARSLGFQGKLCIHPRQLEPVRNAFAPSREEVERATRVVAAYEDEQGARGAILADGQMVDVAVVRAARQVLDQVEAGAR